MRCNVSTSRSTCGSRTPSIVLGMALHLKWSARVVAVDIDGAIDDAFRATQSLSIRQTGGECY